MILFHIPAALREFAGGHNVVRIDFSGGTLSEALSALWAVYPGVRDRMADEQGHLRQHINIFLGNEDVRYMGGMATPIPKGAQLSIVPAVSGGSHQSR